MKKAVIFLLTVIIFSQGAKYLLAAPGDADDPVVTLSYIKQILLPDIEQKINSSSAAVFKVVDVPQGSKVIFRCRHRNYFKNGQRNGYRHGKRRPCRCYFRS